jgi:hypothetical protein
LDDEVFECRFCPGESNLQAKLTIQSRKRIRVPSWQFTFLACCKRSKLESECRYGLIIADFTDFPRDIGRLECLSSVVPNNKTSGAQVANIPESRGFQLFMALNIKNAVFWDVTPCNLLDLGTLLVPFFFFT